MLFRPLICAFLALTSAATAPAMAQNAGLASRAHPLPVATDFNVITAVDVSDSITRHDEWLQYTGLSRGVVDPRFLTRIGEGQERRIGFMAFTWSSGGNVKIIVPWTVIASPADAQRVARLFDTAPRIDRSGYGSYRPLSLNQPNNGMTDIAEALNSALRLSMTAPFPARRSVVNILSNGVDNNGQNPSAVRDQAIRRGVTINGVVFGGHPDLPGYFRRNIIGGPGAFLMEVEQPADLPRALEKKLWQDLIAQLPGPVAG